MTEINWRAQFDELQQTHGYMSDLGSDVYSGEDLGDEPRHTLTLAGSAAAASEGLAEALEAEWSLYTPQEAAAVAAALHATLQVSSDNLRRLKQSVARMAERGEIDLPDPEDDEDFFDGTDRLSATADELDVHLELMLPPAVASLNAVPAKVPTAATVHENMLAITETLGAPASLVQARDEDHFAEATDSTCGCIITIPTGNDDFFRFDYTGLDWVLMPNSAAQERGGQRFWSCSDGISLDATDPLAHPGQIAAIVRSHVPRAVVVQ